MLTYSYTPQSTQNQTFVIWQIPVLQDNYIYMLANSENGQAAVIDPALADPVLQCAKENNLTITHIFNTHHHNDHTGGNLAIKSATNCTIFGPRAEAKRILGIDQQFGQDDRFNWCDLSIKVMDIPGHTLGHIAYWIEDLSTLFCGDTLFSLGCGRVFEGTHQQMWNSLLRLRELPDNTQCYCAHEYSETNARFAITIEPDNQDLHQRISAIKDRRAKSLPTVPMALGDEIATNPFLRADNQQTKLALDMVEMQSADVFAHIRTAKDRF